MEYQVAIPSHRRRNVLEKETLATLIKGLVEPERVTVFLSDAEDASEYQGLLPANQLIVTGAKNLTDKFNIIHRHYEPGTRVFVMEDDVQLIYGSGKANDGRPLDDVNSMVKRGFEACGGGLWGIVPHNNAFFFGGGVSQSLKLIVAHAFGFVSTHDKWLEVEQPSKTDYERTCRYWVRYGAVTRLDNYGAKTKSYTRPGGMQSDLTKGERADAEEQSVHNLVQRFPHLLERKVKKTSPFAEMRFLSCKFDVDELQQYQRALDGVLQLGTVSP